MKNSGIVYLAGAGPGDAGLITLRAASLLEEADVVVYDWLVNPDLLNLAAHAEKIYVGKNIKKRPLTPTLSPQGRGKGEGYVDQGQTNQLLVKLARQGKTVVRLKGGDPFIFGRGGEEASYLKKAGVRFEVVPGVSAGYAAPAYAGIPVTDRRLASLVTFVTGHEQGQGDRLKRGTPGSKVDWKKLAGIGGTLVSFMGVKNLPQLVKSLLNGGKSANTPVCVIEWGTLPRQRVAEGTLRTIVKKVRDQKIESPAVTVIGEVNRLRKELKWFSAKNRGGSAELLRQRTHPSVFWRSGGGKRPLAGKTVLVTRARSQASQLRRILEHKGARVLEFPAIEILPPADPGPLDQALAGMSRFDWIVFTSANAVQHVFSRLEKMGRDARVFAHAKIAAIGEATEETLRSKGLRADLVPEKFTSETLADKLREKKEIIGRHFLLPRTDIAPDYLRTQLETLGAKVTEVVAYRTVPAREDAKKLAEWIDHEEIDFVTFASSSTVKNFFDALPEKKRSHIKSRFVSIGPVTSETLATYGYKPYREARPHTIPGLVEAMIHD